LRRWLFDINLVLDLVLDRRPHSEAAAALWAAAERHEIEAVLPAHGITTVFYVVSRERDAAHARRIRKDLLLVPSIAAVDGATLQRAMGLGWPDFEDALCAAAAEAASCDLLVTRDPAGFKASPVLVVDPVTALSLIRGGAGRVEEPPAPRYRARPGSRKRR